MSNNKANWESLWIIHKDLVKPFKINAFRWLNRVHADSRSRLLNGNYQNVLHLFQGFALCFGHHSPGKDDGNDT